MDSTTGKQILDFLALGKQLDRKIIAWIVNGLLLAWLALNEVCVQQCVFDVERSSKKDNQLQQHFLSR
jgi:hypothetical protein